MFDKFPKNSAVKKTAASWLLVILFCNLVFAGLAVPQKKAQAFGEEWATIANYFTNAAKFTWDKIKWVYEKSADAIQSGVAAWQKSEALWVKATKAAWNILRKKLLDMLVNDTIKWIQGAGDGTPLFVTDWQKYWHKVVNQAGGQFIDEYLNLDLCQTLKPNLNLLLNASQTPYEQSVACTLDEIENTLGSFFKDFNAGGWKTWASVSEGQNNLYGAYLFGADQLMGSKASALRNAENEYISSGGFLGDKVCVQGYMPLSDGTRVSIAGLAENPKKQNEMIKDSVCTRWETRTPGKIIADTASKTIGIDIDWLISADEFNEYAGAILDAVVNRVSREGLARVKSAINKEDEKYHGYTPSAEELVNPNTFSDTQESQNLTISFIRELNRIYQNLITLKKQGRTNLEFIEENLKRQRLALDTLSWTTRNGCDGFLDFLNDEDKNKNEYVSEPLRITDVTNSEDISVLYDFPTCGTISHPGVNTAETEVKVEFDRIGWIVFSLSQSNSPCLIKEESSKTQVEDFLKDDLNKLRERYSPESLWIDSRQQLVAEAKNLMENFRTSENSYYEVKQKYLATGEIDSITGLPIYNAGLPQELQTGAAELKAAKEKMDSDSLKAAGKIKEVIEKLAEQDSSGKAMSVSLQNKNTNLPQLFREVQEISSNIADEASSVQTVRGVDQTSLSNPTIKCTDEQRSGNTLVSDLCYATEVLKAETRPFLHAYKNQPNEEGAEIHSDLITTIATHFLKYINENNSAYCPANKK